MTNDTPRDKTHRHLGDYLPLICIVLILLIVIMMSVLPYPYDRYPQPPATNPAASYSW